MNRPERVIQRPTIDDPNLIEDLRNMIEDICWTPSRNQLVKQGSNSTDISMGKLTTVGEMPRAGSEHMIRILARNKNSDGQKRVL